MEDKTRNTLFCRVVSTLGATAGQTADLQQLIRPPHTACHSWHGAGKGECCKTPVQRQGTALVRSSAEDTTQAADIVHAFERTANTVKVTSEACTLEKKMCWSYARIQPCGE